MLSIKHRQALKDLAKASIGHGLKYARPWLELHEYESIQQLKGSLSQQHAINPADYERANYIEVLDSYTSSSGVLR